MSDDSQNQDRVRRRPHSGITGGLILILLGVLFLLTEMGRIGWADWWAYFLVGLGGIFLLEAAIQAASAEGRRRIPGRIAAGLILVVIGGAHLIGFMAWWPLILIAIGIVLVISPLLRKN
jgi:hypothetical protein